jgi:hypothetical protein
MPWKAPAPWARSTPSSRRLAVRSSPRTRTSPSDSRPVFSRPSKVSPFLGGGAYRVPEQDVATGEFDKNGEGVQIPGVRSRLSVKERDCGRLRGWRGTCRTSDERTMISAAAPAHGFGHD